MAIVRDKEITVGELRFLYSDEDVLENIEGTIKLELMLQDAKRMNLDVSDDIHSQREAMLMLPLKDKDDPIGNSIGKFVDSQAQKFGMKPEAYYKEYVEIRSEQIAYMNAYMQKMFGKPNGFNEEELEIYNKTANDFLNELVKKHETEIEIRMKEF